MYINEENEKVREMVELSVKNLAFKKIKSKSKRINQCDFIKLDYSYK
ncbi:hypothetical protein [Clostridium beijerinckii]|nr:hypothetical protein [Clostridium beijerinckii]NRV88023.1 hypothetical protein [Clostridium beijerinckii]